MNYYDIIAGYILLVAAYKGFKRGLVFELISIVGLIIAIYGAFKFSNMAEVYLLEHAKDIRKIYSPAFLHYCISYYSISDNANG